MTNPQKPGRTGLTARRDGTYHPNQAKLTPDMVREARRLRNDEGIKYDALAAEFGVDKKAIWNAINRRTWKLVK